MRQILNWWRRISHGPEPIAYRGMRADILDEAVSSHFFTEANLCQRCRNPLGYWAYCLTCFGEQKNREVPRQWPPTLKPKQQRRTKSVN